MRRLCKEAGLVLTECVGTGRRWAEVKRGGRYRKIDNPRHTS